MAVTLAAARLGTVRLVPRPTTDASLADVLVGFDERLGPIPSALLDAASRRALADATRTLPAALSRWCYLEFRLAAGARDVDLVVYVDRAAAALVAGRDAATPLAAGFAARVRATPAWAPVIALCEAWLDGHLPAAVDHLWLEFDLGPAHEACAAGAPPEAADALATPGAFVCLGERPTSHHDAAAHAAGLRHALGALDPSVARSHDAALARAVARAPAGAFLPYVGLMFQRAGRAVPAARLCLTRADERSVMAWVRAAGCAAPATCWNALAATLAVPGDALTADRPDRPGARRLTMTHVDVTADGLAPRLGFEYGLHRAPQFDGGVRERALLDACVRRGWAEPARCDALAGLPRAARAALPGDAHAVPALRFVNHLKLVWTPDAPPVVKAYVVLARGTAPAPPPPCN